MSNTSNILVIGAGFAGAVYARTLAENGYSVDVIDKRNHIAGNAYDSVDTNGIRVHSYGPHLFHTKIKRVYDWLKNYGEFTAYEHKVRGLLSSGLSVPIPINQTTINAVFSKNFTRPVDVEMFLNSISLSIENPQNAAEYLASRIGTELTDLFFRPYTKKMWGLDLEEMAAAVVKRIPINYDDTDTYFDRTDMQMLPVRGYTDVFNNIFNHQNIRVNTDVAFERQMEKSYQHCFNSMPIDEYFECCEGELPYRSIKFEHSNRTSWDMDQFWAVTNFTDSRKFTRETAWHVMPNHIVFETGRRTFSTELPCDYKENNLERYYPVKTSDGRNQIIYERYMKIADKLPNMSFIGRCGTYQYLDMDQVINQSLVNVNKWLAKK